MHISDYEPGKSQMLDSKTAVIHSDFEFLDRSRQGTSFFGNAPWRLMRIQSDLVQGVEVMTRELSQHEQRGVSCPARLAGSQKNVGM